MNDTLVKKLDDILAWSKSESEKTAAAITLARMTTGLPENDEDRAETIGPYGSCSKQALEAWDVLREHMDRHSGQFFDDIMVKYANPKMVAIMIISNYRKS